LAKNKEFPCFRPVFKNPLLESWIRNWIPAWNPHGEVKGFHSCFSKGIMHFSFKKDSDRLKLKWNLGRAALRQGLCPILQLKMAILIHNLKSSTRFLCPCPHFSPKLHDIWLGSLSVLFKVLDNESMFHVYRQTCQNNTERETAVPSDRHTGSSGDWAHRLVVLSLQCSSSLFVTLHSCLDWFHESMKTVLVFWQLGCFKDWLASHKKQKHVLSCYWMVYLPQSAK